MIQPPCTSIFLICGEKDKTNIYVSGGGENVPEEEPIPVYEIMTIGIKRAENFSIDYAFKESVWVLGQCLFLSDV